MIINTDQRLFVINRNGYTTCLGFDVCYKRLKQYNEILGRQAPDPSKIGTTEQYEAYKLAEADYIASKPQQVLYDPDTLPQVKRILENARASKARVRIFYGDAETGRDWLEERDTLGRVSSTMGPIRSPILVCNSRSMGGGIICSACIVKITIDKAVQYMHPKYHLPEFKVEPSDLEGYAENVTADGKIHARFKRPRQAQNWIKFMRGERNRV